MPIAHPGLMRLLDYQRYDVEVHDGWVFFEAPLRDKPSGNRLERIYQRMVHRCPGSPRPTPGSGVTSYIYPNTTIDLYPDQVNTWQINPLGLDRTHELCVLPRGEPERADARDPALEPPAQQRGRRGGRGPRRPRAGRHGDARLAPGPLGEREAAVAWFAEHVRRDLEAFGE